VSLLSISQQATSVKHKSIARQVFYCYNTNLKIRGENYAFRAF